VEFRLYKWPRPSACTGGIHPLRSLWCPVPGVWLTQGRARRKRIPGLCRNPGLDAQQGFYVYRHRRSLYRFEWLRLGRPNPWDARRKEQYVRPHPPRHLNDSDRDWHWSEEFVKSPPLVRRLDRDRLKDLAEAWTLHPSARPCQSSFGLSRRAGARTILFFRASRCWTAEPEPVTVYKETSVPIEH